MGFARVAGVPVILAGDIDRGGVIASLVGTHAVLDAADRAMIRGYLINKFRGDVRLLDAGLAAVSWRTGWTGRGVGIGREACRERVWQEGWDSVVARRLIK